MKNNLFISYDLMKKGQNYDAIQKAIKSLGGWAKVTESFFYVRTSYSINQALDIVKASIDANDKVIIVDANAATWTTSIPEEVSKFIKNNWMA